MGDAAPESRYPASGTGGDQADDSRRGGLLGALLGDRRLRRAGMASAASILSRASSLPALIFTLPVALAHLGAERFGLWMLVSSLVIALAFADFGIGSGVLNEVSAARGMDDKRRLRSAISTGIALSALIALVLFCLVTAFLPLVPFADLLNLKGALARAEAEPALEVFAVCFALALPLSVCSRVQEGLQDGFVSNAATAAANLLTFVTVLMAILADWGVPALTGVLFGTPVIVQLAVAVWYFSRAHADLRPAKASIAKPMVSSLMRTGAAFFLMQFFSIAVARLDGFLVARFAGPEEAGLFATADRFFSIAAAFSLAIIYPLWPAFREALHSGELAWVRTYFIKLVLVSGGLALALCIPLVIAAGPAFTYWFAHPIDLPFSLVLGMAAWKIAEVVFSSGSILINATGNLRLATKLLAMMAAASIGLKLLLLPQLGYAAIPWISAGVLTLLGVVPLALVLPGQVRRYTSHAGDRPEPIIEGVGP